MKYVPSLSKIVISYLSSLYQNFSLTKTCSFQLLQLFSALRLPYYFLCSSSAISSTQPMKQQACMLQPCRLRTLLLQQTLYHLAAFHFNLLLRCSVLLHRVVVISLKLEVVLDVLKYCPPIKNVLLHTVEALISGLHSF